MLSDIFKSPKKLLITGLAGVLLVLTLSTFPVHAQNAKDAVCAGLGAVVDGPSNCTDPEDSTTLGGTVASVINILSVVVGAISVIMIIVAGLKYVTSQGESAATASAKNTIIYAMVGLVVVALSQVLVRFVLERSTSVDPPVPAEPAPTTMIRSRDNG